MFTKTATCMSFTIETIRANSRHCLSLKSHYKLGDYVMKESKDELISLVNRQRSKGYKYTQIKEQLVKMGNTIEDSESAIAEYIRNIIA